MEANRLKNLQDIIGRGGRGNLEDLEEAIIEGKIEYLYTAWKNSLSETSGGEVRNLITGNLDVLSDILELPHVSSFKDLIDLYDRKKFMNF